MVDPPSDVVAHRVEDVIPRAQLRQYLSWARKMDNAFRLAQGGRHDEAKRAAPKDLLIDASYY